jgi:hypothetical protein
MWLNCPGRLIQSWGSTFRITPDASAIQFVEPVNGNHGRRTQLCKTGRAAIARVARLARTGEGLDHARFAINFADTIVVLSDVQIAGRTDGNRVG